MRPTAVTISVTRHQFDGTTRPDSTAVVVTAAASSGFPAASRVSPRSNLADAVRRGRATRSQQGQPPTDDQQAAMLGQSLAGIDQPAEVREVPDNPGQ